MAADTAANNFAKAFALVVILGALRFGLNLYVWFRVHTVRYTSMSTTGVYGHFRIKRSQNQVHCLVHKQHLSASLFQ